MSSERTSAIRSPAEGREVLDSDWPSDMFNVDEAKGEVYVVDASNR